MKKSFWLFLFFGISQLISAQYTDVINSNRPGFSSSPFSVGSNVYQIESGIFYRKSKIKNGFSNPSTIGLNLSFRFSKFKEKLEFNVDLAYAVDRLAFKNISTTYYTIYGFSQATIGAKYLLYKTKYTDKSVMIRSWKKRMAFDKKRLIPNVGVYVGVNLPILNDFYQNSISPKIAVFLQNDITNKYNVLTNFILDKTGSLNSSFSYIITQTYTFNDKYSAFFEILGKNYSNYNNEFQIAGGAAFLKNKDLQFDTSLRLLMVNNSANPYIGIGASWRINNHLSKLRQKSDEAFLNGKNYDKKKARNKKNTLINTYSKPRKIKKPKRKIISLKKKKSKSKKGIFSNFFKKKKGKKKNKKNSDKSE